MNPSEHHARAEALIDQAGRKSSRADREEKSNAAIAHALLSIAGSLLPPPAIRLPAPEEPKSNFGSLERGSAARPVAVPPIDAATG